MTKKYLFLTSMVAMGFVAQAIAEPTNTGTFPSTGLMQEDYTYTNAATSTNMAGVYEGSVTAEAQYTDNLYTLVAGQYLPANSETPITCNQNGYFCPGDSNGVYYSSSAQGLTECPTGYGNTANGASANTDCYRTCTNADVAHSSGTVNGGYYYGDNNQCEPTGCENGYHVGGLDVVFKTPIVPIDYNDTTTTYDYGYINADGTNTYQASNYGLTNNNTWAAEYEDGTIVSGRASCQATATPDTMAVLYIGSNLQKVQSGEMQFSELKAGVAQLVGNEKANWFENVFNQTMAGQLTEAQAGAKLAGMFYINEDANYATNSTGQYCYCQMTGYTPSGGTLQAVLSPWVFNVDAYGNASYCAGNCASSCAYFMSLTDSSALAFRGALFGSVAPTLASCEANTITINWTGTSETEINANNAGTATYGSDIRTPRSATPIPGKTFTGWRFVAPQQVSSGN